MSVGGTIFQNDGQSGKFRTGTKIHSPPVVKCKSVFSLQIKIIQETKQQ